MKPVFRTSGKGFNQNRYLAEFWEGWKNGRMRWKNSRLSSISQKEVQKVSKMASWKTQRKRARIRRKASYPRRGLTAMGCHAQSVTERLQNPCESCRINQCA